MDGLRMIKLTVGAEEEELMKKQNIVLQKRGLPFFKRVDKQIGKLSRSIHYSFID